MRNVLLIAIACLIGCGSARAEDACPTTLDPAELAIDYAAFDGADWRQLIFNGCEDAAVARIEAYRVANEAHLSSEQVRELHFHVGQALAMTGHQTESAPHFERARGGDQEWSAYVDATLAFVRHDAAALQQARARYASAPNASAARLGFIDGFIACPSESYMGAVHCAAAH